MATVATTTRSTTYTLAVASDGPFEVGYRIFSTDLIVYLDGVPTEDYSLSATFADGYCDSAEVTLDEEQAIGTKVTIDSVLPFSRSEDWLVGDPSLTRKLNIEQAREFALSGDLRRDVDRAVKTNPIHPVTGVILPVGETGRTLIWDDDGELLINGPSSDEVAYAQAAGVTSAGFWRATMAALAADEVFSYTAGDGLVTVTAGDYIVVRDTGFVFEVAASNATILTGYSWATAGGVRLKPMPINQAGAYHLAQFNITGTGSTPMTETFSRAILWLQQFDGGTILLDSEDYNVALATLNALMASINVRFVGIGTQINGASIWGLQGIQELWKPDTLALGMGLTDSSGDRVEINFFPTILEPFNAYTDAGAMTVKMGRSDISSGTLLQLIAQCKDSGGALQNFASIQMISLDSTAGGEDGSIKLNCTVAGTETTMFELKGGEADGTYVYVNSQLKQVTRGASDSGGTGFRLLRVAN